MLGLSRTGEHQISPLPVSTGVNRCRFWSILCLKPVKSEDFHIASHFDPRRQQRSQQAKAKRMWDSLRRVLLKRPKIREV